MAGNISETSNWDANVSSIDNQDDVQGSPTGTGAPDSGADNVPHVAINHRLNYLKDEKVGTDTVGLFDLTAGIRLRDTVFSFYDKGSFDFAYKTGGFGSLEKQVVTNAAISSEVKDAKEYVFAIKDLTVDSTGKVLLQTSTDASKGFVMVESTLISGDDIYNCFGAFVEASGVPRVLSYSLPYTAGSTIRDIPANGGPFGSSSKTGSGPYLEVSTGTGIITLSVGSGSRQFQRGIFKFTTVEN